MVRASIVNVTGYAGVELARILSRHPQVELVEVTGRSASGQPLGSVFPHLAGLNMTIKADLEEQADVAFLALPHRAAAEAAPALLDRGVKIVDLSADFRLKSAQEFEEWYGVTHPSPGLLPQAVYGLTELYREQVAGASLVANPGCYPTSAILALAPVLRAGLVEPDAIIDSKSGVAGAGRSLSLTTHYSEVNESVSAYGIATHRHTPEIAQELSRQAARSVSVTFTPHLVPMTRGILSTCYAKLVREMTPGDIRQVFVDCYIKEKFVRVVDQPPATKQVWGSNYCHIYPTVDQRTGRLIVVSVIDNLVKGAAGQAVQNMNVMFGLPEDSGLDFWPVYP
jgi:N-acetyl-gamma-glutamyl-phosphate reductase